MRLEQIYYIVTIEEAGSISEASKRLYVAQPSISQALSNLEEELQTQIFIRNRNGVVPTVQGVQILKHARRILNEVEEIKDLTTKEDTKITGEIRVGAIPTLSTYLLPKVVAKFRNQFPNVQIKIVELGSQKIAEECVKGMLDVGLVSIHGKNDFPSELYFTPLLNGRLMAYVGSRSTLKERQQVSFRELLPYDLLLYGQQFSLHKYCLEQISKYGEPRILSTTQNPETIKQFVIQSEAVGFGPDIGLKNDIYVENRMLFPLWITDALPIVFGMVKLREKKPNFLLNAFIQEIMKQKKND